MAKLVMPVPGHWDYWYSSSYTNVLKKKLCDCNDWDDHYAKEEKDLKAIQDSSQIMTFPVGDGSAMYKVVKENPLTLAHIPYGDAYQIAPAYIRGLQYSDLVSQREFADLWKRLGEKKDGPVSLNS